VKLRCGLDALGAIGQASAFRCREMRCGSKALTWQRRRFGEQVSATVGWQE
jgi:hypothetical protein